VLDSTKLLLAGIVTLLTVLAALLAVVSRSPAPVPDLVGDFVLYALSATNLAMLLALGFVLARNVVKLVVERRRALPFSRFRAKLVAVLLGMSLIPAVLVLLIGSELIRGNLDRWFNADLAGLLSSAGNVAADYYQERARLVSVEAERLSRALAATPAAAQEPAALRALIDATVVPGLVDAVHVYPVGAGPDGGAAGSAAGSGMAAIGAGQSSPSVDRLVARAASAGGALDETETVPDGGEIIRRAVPVRPSPGEPVVGVVVVSEYVPGQFRRMTEAYESYQQLYVLRRPLTGFFQSFFLLLTLMILVSATWVGLYLAKRITRPVQRLAAAADEIGAGHLDHRVEPGANDEFGSLIEAFNRMASDLGASRRRLERAAVDLERKHLDVESRRRYVETVLDRVATGVVSVDAAGRIRTWNSAASRLLGFDVGVSGLPAAAVFGSAELKPLAAVIDEWSGREDPRPREVTITREDREVHLTVMITPLRREDGGSDGTVLVFDDVSPLVRAQRAAAWREVARRLAHEIKNPLTPIRLCAERLQRHFARAPQPARALVDECAGTIVTEVEALKGLVDEFSYFARMPAPRVAATDLHALLDGALALYQGLMSGVEIRRQFVPSLPPVSVDPEQIRRVVVNLVDNAIEAMDRRGQIVVETSYDPERRVATVVVADDGPGIPPAEREKLFLPTYSTKQRGSGLGLAIVRRIVAEHGGRIEVADNVPRGTRFAIELPC
jgi:two-component system nitrogen regulation sensor histidine kinase NtrY